MAVFDISAGVPYPRARVNILRHTDADYAARRRELAARSSLWNESIDRKTQGILEAVRIQGDAALSEFAERFDGLRLQPDQFRVTATELDLAASRVDTALRQAIRTAHRNIVRFSRKSLRRGWMTRNAQGGRVGEKYDPYRRVGIYVPGGTAPLASTALMTVTLAQVAGCPEVVVCTPCGKDGAVNPGLLYAAQVAGATEVYRIGGAQAIGAMAYGTPAIAKVDKIFGPGNAYVVAAKRKVFGAVAIDLLPGPSEVLVLADDSAPPAYIAADLLAQAEHGSGHERVWLVTPSAALIEAVQREVERQLPGLSRRTHAAAALESNGWLILAPDLDAGIDWANELAPEHCEVMTRHATRVAGKIATAGAICIGPCTPNVLGDYVAGPSHVLPTGGAGRSFSGLTVDQFQRRTSLIQFDRAALRRSGPAVQKFAEIEGLDGHGRSAAIRWRDS